MEIAVIDLALAKKVDIERHFRLAQVRAAYPEFQGTEEPPEEYLLELSPYLLDRPQKFYHELVYENALQYFTVFYAQHRNDLVAHFTYVAPDYHRGMLKTEHFSQVIDQAHLDHLDREARVLGYWCPWYLNLYEGCLKDVCSPLFWAVLQARGKRAQLHDMPYMDKRADVLNTISELQVLCKDLNRTVRNACAHAGVIIAKNRPLLFQDINNPEVEWRDEEFLDHIHSLLDICNALILAIKVFIYRNWSQLSGLFKYYALPDSERERFFLMNAGTPTITIQNAELRTVADGKLQATIEAKDTALSSQELTFDSLAVLQQAHRFYPEADSVFLGLNGPRHWPSYIQVTMLALHNWINGTISFEQFVQTPNIEFIILNFRQPPLANKVAVLRRAIAHGLAEWKIQQREKLATTSRRWKVLDIQDRSLGLVKRLEVRIIVPEGGSRQDIEPMLIEATTYVRNHLYRTKEITGWKRRYRIWMSNRRPGYIWLLVFTKEKRPADMQPDPTASYYVCRTEWFDEQFRSQGFAPKYNFAERIGQFDITVEWALAYQK